MDVGKHITSKDIPLGTIEPLKETKKILEDENEKQVRTIIGGPLKNKEMPKDEGEKWVRTYIDVVYIWKLSN